MSSGLPPRALYLALVHFPVRDRAGARISTAVTNLDVHDIARTARTYGLAGYFVVTPLEAQRTLVNRILDHWRVGAGKRRLPERAEALRITEPLHSIGNAVEAVREATGEAPLIAATSAREESVTLTGYREVAAELAARPGLLLFGTGHGLERETLAEADRLLPPIRGGADYNHLSVRAAVAITLERLIGEGAAPDAERVDAR